MANKKTLYTGSNQLSFRFHRIKNTVYKDIDISVSDITPIFWRITSLYACLSFPDIESISYYHLDRTSVLYNLEIIPIAASQPFVPLN